MGAQRFIHYLFFVGECYGEKNNVSVYLYVPDRSLLFISFAFTFRIHRRPRLLHDISRRTHPVITSRQEVRDFIPVSRDFFDHFLVNASLFLCAK